MDTDEQDMNTDPGTNGQQPNTEVARPGGAGVFSGTSAGPNKREPMSSGQTLGNTIAGRDVDTDSNTSDTNANPDGSDD
ncbi:MAG: hypothetical protein NVS4B2_30640 [Chloroflexota bacterium]